jgi:hypothetical protein
MKAAHRPSMLGYHIKHETQLENGLLDDVQSKKSGFSFDASRNLSNKKGRCFRHSRFVLLGYRKISPWT